MVQAISIIKKTAFLGILGSSVLLSAASAATFTSQAKATEVVELFTSEGCSSCPPAERWLSTLKDQPGVFKDVIPMAFHVDYWDYIGWKDRFAKPTYSERQRDYVRSGLVSQSYTPQLVANSREWQQWHRGQRTWKENTRNVGVLKADVKQDAGLVSVQFNSQTRQTAANYVLNVAILGMGLSTKVTAGENHGELLKHDFVVLNHETQKVSASTKQWQVKLPSIPQAGQQKNAVAVWLSQENNQQVIQATGGYL
ncbi:DUF1223 domain-containing protein [Leucothrix sargassi]|nr:DUF1223 domain-containing protein [Leucothrix sargassi]